MRGLGGAVLAVSHDLLLQATGRERDGAEDPTQAHAPGAYHFLADRRASG